MDNNKKSITTQIKEFQEEGVKQAIVWSLQS